MNKPFNFLRLFLLACVTASFAHAQSDVVQYPNNAYHIINFLVVQDSNIKSIGARKGQTLTDRLYGYHLDELNAQKITFYRNGTIHKMRAPEDQLLTGQFTDSRFGVLDLADLGVHRVVFNKKGDITALHAYEDDIIEGQIGPYILSTFDSNYIAFNTDGKLVTSVKK